METETKNKLTYKRSAFLTRTTRETSISTTVTIEGTGKAILSIMPEFMKHMLETFALWSSLDIELAAAGDITVDFHHLIEDTGIVFGQALNEALGSKQGIRRSAFAYIPMDESLVRTVIDISGRGCCFLSGTFGESAIYAEATTFPVSLIEDFWQAFARSAGVTLHIDILKSRSAHHSIEALFKAAGRALKEACAIEPPQSGTDPQILSVKGVIA
ncbi:MAG TPA: imidazoleglycerol-phosphate dehydratase [Spirochaetia bacterium]|nr:imidazoleglycerol-phosphate dehydratase [Spirochaetales bacterium]HPD79879.1 imidazoleglycerol-phosphate dehydratase [Spirochaetales bacterium]HQG40954.1 imidazoleglycerol-phosphate dehydratase [Spirochaetales bacterium]HQK33266.1 imidazoleglycerol-phosphate dehydratase [Spirochaetales bacterium]HRS66092.1 imidazoleglycerol-phosphate dehydratase [Spirochaetia bacterium]